MAGPIKCPVDCVFLEQNIHMNLISKIMFDAVQSFKI